MPRGLYPCCLDFGIPDMNWYSSRHFRHPVHPQQQVNPCPPTMRANDMQRIPVPVWIAAAIILGLIAIALYGYSSGFWGPSP